eukprot:gene1823-3533_t
MTVIASNRKAYFIFIFVLFIFQTVVCQLYYKNHEGNIYGPFPEEQIQEWWSAGYFSGGATTIHLESLTRPPNLDVLVARSPRDGFCALKDYFPVHDDQTWSESGASYDTNSYDTSSYDSNELQYDQNINQGYYKESSSKKPKSLFSSLTSLTKKTAATLFQQKSLSLRKQQTSTSTTTSSYNPNEDDEWAQVVDSSSDSNADYSSAIGSSSSSSSSSNEFPIDNEGNDDEFAFKSSSTTTTSTTISSGYMEDVGNDDDMVMGAPPRGSGSVAGSGSGSQRTLLPPPPLTSGVEQKHQDYYSTMPDSTSTSIGQKKIPKQNPMYNEDENVQMNEMWPEEFPEEESSIEGMGVTMRKPSKVLLPYRITIQIIRMISIVLSPFMIVFRLLLPLPLRISVRTLPLILGHIIPQTILAVIIRLIECIIFPINMILISNLFGYLLTEEAKTTFEKYSKTTSSSTSSTSTPIPQSERINTNNENSHSSQDSSSTSTSSSTIPPSLLSSEESNDLDSNTDSNSDTDSSVLESEESPVSDSEFQEMLTYIASGIQKKLRVFTMLAIVPFIISNVAMLSEMYMMNIPPPAANEDSNSNSGSERSAKNNIQDDAKRIRNDQIRYMDDILSGKMTTSVSEFIERWTLTPVIRRIREDLMKTMTMTTENASNNDKGGVVGVGGGGDVFISMLGESRRTVWTTGVCVATVVSLAVCLSELGRIGFQLNLNLLPDDNGVVRGSLVHRLLIRLFEMISRYTSMSSLSLSSTSTNAIHKMNIIIIGAVILSWPINSWTRFLSTRQHMEHGVSAATTILLREECKKRKDEEDKMKLLRHSKNVPEGWTTDGPDPRAGVQFNGVTVQDNGRVVLQDVSVSFPSGCITVVVGRAPASGKSSLLRTIWGDGTLHVVRGEVSIRGRPVGEWDKRALRERMSMLKEEEERLWLPAAILAGLFGMARDRDDPTHIERQRRAVEASGAAIVFDSLPYGANSFLSASTTLNPAQWRCLEICRALCEVHKDIMLLDCPLSYESESQEADIFRALRASLRRDQSIVMTCNRFASAIHADRVVVMSRGSVVQQGTYAQLISQPGPFRDELMPPPRVFPTTTATASATQSFQNF